MESSGARPEHGPDKGHRGRCTRRQGISRPGSLSLCLSLSSPLLSSSLHFTSLLQRIHTHTTHNTHKSHGAQFRSVPFRSVPFRTVRSYRTNVSCAVSLPTPRLTSLRLASRRLASSFSPPLTPYPRSLARCLGFANLATPCFHRLSLALTLTLSQTNVGFVGYIHRVVHGK